MGHAPLSFALRRSLLAGGPTAGVCSLCQSGTYSSGSGGRCQIYMSTYFSLRSIHERASGPLAALGNDILACQSWPALTHPACRSPWSRHLQPVSARDLLDRHRSAVAQKALRIVSTDLVGCRGCEDGASGDARHWIEPTLIQRRMHNCGVIQRI